MTMIATMNTPNPTASFRYRRRGFTLIEMIAVVSIIAVLMGLAVTTGVLVIKRQEVATTKGLLSSLDRALEEYIVELGGTIPPYIDTAYFGVPGPALTAGGGFATNDPDDMSPNSFYLSKAYPRHPDAAVFIKQASGIGAVDQIISGLGDRFLIPTPSFDGPDDPDIEEQDVTPSIVDPWGDTTLWAATANDPSVNDWPILDPAARVIFYVHPNNRLAQDLYGECVNGRPYFFSAGPDGLYGTTSQLSGSGTIAPNTIVSPGVNGAPDITYATQAVDALEDNIYSYPVGPAHTDEHFNEMYR